MTSTTTALHPYKQSIVSRTVQPQPRCAVGEVGTPPNPSINVSTAGQEVPSYAFGDIESQFVGAYIDRDINGNNHMQQDYVNSYSANYSEVPSLGIKSYNSNVVVDRSDSEIDLSSLHSSSSSTSFLKPDTAQGSLSQESLPNYSDRSALSSSHSSKCQSSGIYSLPSSISES